MSLVVGLAGKCKFMPTERKDFMIVHGDRAWRGRRDETAVDGLWFRLRLIADEPPSLTALPSPLHPGIVQALLAPRLKTGGLIYVCGSTGSGKTTTASAIVVSRLRQFGGLAYTIEDPPEMPLNGWHGKGLCTQTAVAGDNSADWIESMRGVLRSQPAGTPVMLYIGEVRDAESAQAMLRAASNGFLVVATGFGNDIPTGVDAFANLAGPQSLMTLAAVLRVVMHQRLDGRFSAQIMVSESSTSQIGVLVRSGRFTHLQTEVDYQQQRLFAGAEVWGRPGT